MAHEMTAKWLKTHCKENGGYGTPELNDKLYLHYRGLDKIEGLHQWSGLRALWLEGSEFVQVAEGHHAGCLAIGGYAHLGPISPVP